MKEIWKDIKGYEGLYQVSNLGRIKSLIFWNGNKFIKKEKIINGWIQKVKNNYSRKKVELIKNGKRKEFFIHRLVAEEFIPNPNNYKIINHKDNNPLNNEVNNLEWCTQKMNMEWCTLQKRNTKIQNEKKLIEMYNSNYSISEIKDYFKIKSSGPIYRILKKNNIKDYKKSKYNINLEELKKDINNNMSNNELISKYHCSNMIINTRRYQIKKGMI